MIAWIVILIVAIIVEIITLGLTSIWFAGGALVALIAAALHAPLWLQILLFVAVSLLLLLFTRPIAVKYFNKDRVRTNAESIVGRQGVVTETIDNLQDEDQVIEKGSVVEVVAISGVKLICKAEKKAPAVQVQNAE